MILINHLNAAGFHWFVGVVEDRFDPLKAGRIRVRVYGYHTDDKTQIPTEELFWAQTLMPVTSPSNSNVSETPRLIEGTTVVGFFLDGDMAQQPVIMGSVPGIPQTSANTEKGFYDPTGNYPRSDRLDEPDLSRLARGSDAENNPVLGAVRDSRISDIPEAKAPSITSIVEDSGDQDYEHTKWNQPNPRFGEEEESDRDYESGGSMYGFNQVYESESGHYIEVDDTPGAERLNRTHRTGTYEEILADGTRVTKIVGSDYEIVVGDKKCFVNGNMSVTINGNAKVLIKGDKYEEISGNYHLHVRGDRRTKIEGNDATEIITNESKQINGNQNIRVSLVRADVVLQDSSYTVGNNLTVSVQNDSTEIVVNNKSTTIGNNGAVISQGTLDIGSIKNFNMASAASVNMRSVADMKLQIDANLDFDVSGTLDQDVGGAITIDAGGSIDQTASGEQTLIGSKVKLNP